MRRPQVHDDLPHQPETHQLNAEGEQQDGEQQQRAIGDALTGQALHQQHQTGHRTETEDAWNNGEIDLMFAHPQSAGHGRNLQDGGNILVYFSHWWDLEKRQQILERIGPMRQLQSGYDRPVWVYHIVAVDTFDEDVIARIEDKADLQQVLLDSMRRRME